MGIFITIFQDALFAAIAAIGFAAISHPPFKAYFWCGIIAAAGHSLRFILMSPPADIHIIPASLIAAFAIGLLAVIISAYARFPAETCLYPSLLPMIPGIYAYKCFGGMALCLLSGQQQTFNHYFSLFSYNGMMCCGILIALVVGATLPIFIFKKISFQATR